ncbi:MAG: transposase [Actinobacteria bacterium]|nr:transposase [Actinomycetota bacterium]
MPQNFLSCERDQPLLLPPDLRDWLPEDHLAWFVIGSVEALDLADFYSAYRSDGHGRSAHDPQMMVALLLYAYATGERSSRRMERRCHEDVAYRVIAANRVPDHATIARFRARHQGALAALFTQILGLCVEAGIASAAVVAVDGTKVAADASGHRNEDHEEIAREILAEAGRVDEAEDEIYGDRRGDELPAELATHGGRKEWIREALRRQREAREEDPEPVPRARAERLELCRRRLEDDHRTVVEAHRAYEEAKAEGPRRGRPPTAAEPPAGPEGRVNTTDPDSQKMRSPHGFLQGYNAQALTNEAQVVIAAEVLTEGNDSGALAPMVELATTELGRAGSPERPGILLADAGYRSAVQVDRVREGGAIPLVPPDGHSRGAPDPGGGVGPDEFMRRALRTPTGAALYRRRRWMIEPVFADIKFNRRAGRFRRRGLGAVRSEWRLLTATHNLLKLHRHNLALAAG